MKFKKMVLNCNVKGCRRNSVSDKYHSFFRLPKNPKTCEKWLAFAGCNRDRTHIRICADHFEEKAIRKRYPRPLLVRDVVPTIRVPQKPDSNTKDRPIFYTDESRTTDEQTFACDTEYSKSDDERASLPSTQIINIHVNNVSSITISGQSNKVIVNIINNKADESICSA